LRSGARGKKSSPYERSQGRSPGPERKEPEKGKPEPAHGGKPKPKKQAPYPMPPDLAARSRSAR
jgi:hypothetical protein